MADVSITYKGNEITSMSATGTKTLLTKGQYCEDDFTVAYTQPSAPSPSLQAKTNITPTTSSQIITADQGYDGLSSVQVNGDANLLAENIKDGVTIFGVTGTFEGSGGGGVQTANISVTSSDILYYTDENMTVQSAQYLNGAPAALGTLVVVHNSGPTAPDVPVGVTKMAEYSYRNDTCIVYKVTG